MNTITKPHGGEYSPYYHTYINNVKSDDLIESLEKGSENFINFMNSISTEKFDYRYQEDKWTVKEIIMHHMEVERIFTCRALRFSRNDKTALPGFDENEYIPESHASERSVESLLKEYIALRQSTIEFFKNITVEMSLRLGIANGKEISVRALGFVITGHELHHIAIIKERYL